MVQHIYEFFQLLRYLFREETFSIWPYYFRFYPGISSILCGACVSAILLPSLSSNSAT